jgi:plasmid stability protein
MTSFVQQEVPMPVMTVRKLSEETHRALRLRAASHGRSTEAEVRAILEDAVRPERKLKIGSALMAIGQAMGGIDLPDTRDRTPVVPISFE